jgi:hypothetical protein
MPVVQLQDDTGSNIGSALGAVAGYFATQKQRKADKATAVADKQHTTAREDAAAADTHADIQSKIKQRDTQDTALTANSQAAQNALGAYNTYFPMLSNPPTKPGDPPLHGPALAKALQNVRIEAMNKGAFSDEKTAQQRQTDFNTEIARILQEDKAASTQSFLGKEAKTAIPGDPQQMLNFLLKHRLPAERAAGIDTKDTMAMITDAQRQVNEANLEKQRQVNEANLEKQRGVQNQNAGQRIQISLDRANNAGTRASSAAGDPQSLKDVGGRLAKAKTRDEAQAILDSPEGSLLSDRQYTRLQKQVDETFGTHVQADPHKKTGVSQGDTDWKTISGSDPVKKLDPEVRAALQQGVSAYGLQGVITHLRGGAIPPGLNQTQAQKMLKAVGG